MFDTDAKHTQTIGHISDTIMCLLSYSETSLVIFTKERLEKNKLHHKELSLDYYQFLKELIENPSFVCANKNDKQTVIFYYGPVQTINKDDQHFLRAAILLKSPKEPPEYMNSIQSFRFCRKKEIQKDINRNRLLWKNRKF